eukprot:2915652-Prymnesium_polylepis.1
MDPGSCMRRCISVLRLNRPESATIYGIYWGLRPSAAPVTCGQGEVGWRRRLPRTDRPPDAPRGRAPGAPRTTQMSVPSVVRSGSMLCRCGATQ